VGGKEAYIMIYSGATKNYVDAKFMKKAGITGATLYDDTNPSVVLANGTKQAVTHLVPSLTVHVDNYRQNLQCYVTDLGSQYDLILGKSWLTMINPHIDWRSI